jgi:hypothetical protein
MCVAIFFNNEVTESFRISVRDICDVFSVWLCLLCYDLNALYSCLRLLSSLFSTA